MRSRDDDIEVYLLWTVVIRLRVDLVQVVRIRAPKLASIQFEHQVADPLGLDHLRVYQVLDELLCQLLSHVLGLHYI